MFTLLDPAEVEQRLERLITKHKGKDISVTEIKRRIFETGNDDVMRESNLFNKWWINCFHRIDEAALQELLQAFQDAWNSFPHSSLDGRSPQQVMQEEVKKHPEMRKNMNEKDMPTVTVGGRTRSWEDHWKMIRRMEELQKPFKHWIEERALPGYRKFLQTKYKTKKAIEKHYDVADNFFKRALHVGFLDFEQIRPAFAVWEFPDWWPSHILYSNLNEDQVWSSLSDFLWFIEVDLHRSIPGIREEAVGEELLLDDRVVPPSLHATHIPKIGRNDPCPCGAKKPDGRPIKYKHCHEKA